VDLKIVNPPFLEVSQGILVPVLRASGVDLARVRAARAPVVRELPGLTVRLGLKDSVLASLTAPNVVGILEGRDPSLKHEYLVYSAHMDHIGITPGRPDSINNGADDDASGTTGVIELAEAFSRPGARPRRSIVFLTVSGEEKGLWGSRYFTEHPPVPIQQIVADINSDMIGRNWPDTVVAIGKEHSDLGATLQAVAAALGDELIPDPMPEEKSFYRSDHYAFVKKGIPALMLLGAPDITKEALVARIKDYEKRAYHLPADMIQPDWNWEGPLGLAQVGLVVGLRVANTDALPAWLSSSPFNRKRGTDEPPPPEP
jgi:Zn-dependent M28 family amino/carboxypeptidase